jgi:1,4-dihydroxy-6-naphthoate synthase
MPTKKTERKPAPAEKPAAKAKAKSKAAAAPSKAAAPKSKSREPAAASAKTKPKAGSATRPDRVAEPAAAVEAPPKPPPKLPPRKAGVITVAYSPDADDAFMFYALASGKVDTEDRKYEFVRSDIQSLNEEAQTGTHDVTAISFGAYPQVLDRYVLLTCGGSFGDQVGPLLVAKTPVRANEVDGLTVAVPGLLTTAALVLRLWLPRAKLKLVPVPFDAVGAAVRAGKTRAGLIIHEGQLTYRSENLVRVVDLGQWWGERTEGLPLPLGGNVVRRDVPAAEQAHVALDLKRSIAYALGHREEALDFALQFGRGLARDVVDRYVGMYVNELTLDYGERGRQALSLLFEEAHRNRLLPRRVTPEFIG